MGDPNQLLYLKAWASGIQGPILEVGSKDYGSTQDFRSLFPGKEYIGVDLSEGKNVDVVLNLQDGTGDLPRNHFGLIICCSVLEHVQNPWAFAHNITRLLRPGGAMYIAVPWVWKFHAYPDDFWRFSWRGIEVLFPLMEWTDQKFSTTVTGEFKPAVKGADNAMAEHAAGGQRKYLPYLQLNMLGVKTWASQ